MNNGMLKIGDVIDSQEVLDRCYYAGDYGLRRGEKMVVVNVGEIAEGATKGYVTVRGMAKASAGQVFNINITQSEHESIARIRATDLKGVVKGLFRDCIVPAYGVNVGADPEMFMFDKTGQVVPRWEVLGRKVAGPQQLFWDGVQGEFTICAQQCHEVMLYYVREMMRKYWQRVKNYSATAYLDPVRTVVEVPGEVLKNANEEYIKLGCSPSRNAYGIPGIGNVDGRKLKWRFSGCHLHYGVGKIGEELAREAVKTMDAITGVMMTVMFEGYEDRIRRQFYGRPGEYRLPQHGLEWRVPSSVIMAHPGLMMLVLDVNRVALNVGMLGLREQVWQATEEEVVEVVGGYNYELGRKILERNKKRFEEILGRCYRGILSSVNIRKTQKFIVDGVGLKNAETMKGFERNWELDRSGDGFAKDMWKWKDVVHGIVV
jgi:hypothetical protein